MTEEERDDPTRGGTHRIVGRGSDVAIEVDGPTLEACLAAAVEGFASALATVAPGAPRHQQPVSVPGDAPADLLVGLIDEAILLVDADGLLAVRLARPRLGGEGLRATLELVALDDVRVHGTPPKAATWHEARLAPTGDGWGGHVMLDL